MMIRQARLEDANKILEIINDGKAFLLEQGISQWSDDYPNMDIITNEIDDIYLSIRDGEIAGCMSIKHYIEEYYDKIDGKWLCDTNNYTTLHRLSVSKKFHRQGVAKELFKFAIDYSYKLKVDSIRVDTKKANVIMNNLFLKLGFTYCGVVYAFDKFALEAYEMKLNRGLVVVNGFKMTDSLSKTISRYIEEFANMNVILDVKKNDEVLAYIENNKVKTNLKLYDFVLYLDKDKHIAKLLESSGLKLFNNADSIEVCNDKMMTYIALLNHDIKMPKTISSPLYYGGKDDDTFINKVIQLLDFPMIVKEAYGSFGKQVYLINNKEELLDKRNELRNVPHLYQEYIKTSRGKDIRAICVNKKVVASMLRKNEKDFRSNIELGGHGECYELTEENKKTIENIATILNLDYCGLDLLFGKNDELILCEVNSNAMLNEIEKVTKINVCKLYCEYIYSTIYGGKN